MAFQITVGCTDELQLASLVAALEAAYRTPSGHRVRVRLEDAHRGYIWMEPRTGDDGTERPDV